MLKKGELLGATMLTVKRARMRAALPAYEIGTKTALFDRRLRPNLSAFHYN